MPSRLLAPAAGFISALLLSAGVAAQTGGVEIKDVWARATPGGAATAAVYLTIVSAKPDRLIGISTSAAQQAEFHSMTMDGGVMKMRQVDAIDLPAGQAVTLKPGGFHIMLTGLAKPLKEGESFPLTLSLEHSGQREVTVTVQKIGAMGPQAAPGGGMPMPGMHH